MRGHTGALASPRPRSMKNWMLATARSETTGPTLNRAAAIARFTGADGLADGDPFGRANCHDARHRRVSIILAWWRGCPPGIVGREEAWSA